MNSDNVISYTASAYRGRMLFTWVLIVSATNFNEIDGLPRSNMSKVFD
jgi:hypothetical protein